ncbi:MAG: bifunctional 2-C-methyl-D-erythritol 4-phosphate cytidylyltransferase/2-C-methyl-D-erythritol 2,4-cyclodiphosphate synthase [Alsobacter sp.]
MIPSQPVAALIVAAGSGSRAGLSTPKQYARLDGASVLARSISALAADGAIETILCVIRPEDADPYASAIAELVPAIRARLAPPVHGGATRQASVRAGLEALAAAAAPPALVLVHDAARPFVSPQLVHAAIAAGHAYGAAIPGLPVTDTVKQVDDSGRVVATPPRAALRAVQTPQAFALAPLLDAHRAAAAAGREDLTDDAAVVEWAGRAVHVFPGEPANMKLTHPQDFAGRGGLVGRTGFGFDVHAFGPGDAVMLGGVSIAFDRGLAGHSDADVVLHALTDAVLGALSDGDIGAHFPPSDPQWKGASSDRFLAFAVERLRARGGVLDHCDITIVCEAPKIGPHRDAMRTCIAAICDIPPGRVAVKATTSERLGFTGRGEGIAAQAVASVRLPDEDGR